MTDTTEETPEKMVSTAEFAKLVVPLTDAIAELVGSARADRPEDAAPTADSMAMAELANQLKFPDDKEGVVDVALTLAAQLAYVGEDHILAARTLLLARSEAFVYSVPVLGRASIEAFANAFHLSDPHISNRLRAGRTMNELISSGKALDKLPDEIERPEARAAHRRAQAESMGLTRMKDKQGKNTGWFEEHHPSYTQLVADLFRTEDLGSTLYNLWSAVTHGSSWGLSQSFGEPVDHPSGFGLRAPVVQSLQTVKTTCMSLIDAHHETVGQLEAWTGWGFPTYKASFAERIARLNGVSEEVSHEEKADAIDVSRPSDLLWFRRQ